MRHITGDTAAQVADALKRDGNAFPPDMSVRRRNARLLPDRAQAIKVNLF